MVLILPEGSILEDYEIGKVVLALHPRTSIFCRATVKGTTDDRSETTYDRSETTDDGFEITDDGSEVKLLFEGDVAGITRIVHRRWVLDYKDWERIGFGTTDS